MSEAWAIVLNHRNTGISVEGIFLSRSDALKAFKKCALEWTHIEAERWDFDPTQSVDYEVSADWAHIDETVSLYLEDAPLGRLKEHGS
jgi:hypothetical protein